MLLDEKKKANTEGDKRVQKKKLHEWIVATFDEFHSVSSTCCFVNCSWHSTNVSMWPRLPARILYYQEILSETVKSTLSRVEVTCWNSAPLYYLERDDSIKYLLIRRVCQPKR